MYARKLSLKAIKRDSFFLWGLRQAGKSSLLKVEFPNAFRVDLLRSSERIQYELNPSLLRERVLANPICRKYPVIIDEIQKVPSLLDEVHS